jgi:tetratricopeptide (TPR) repeat protein
MKRGLLVLWVILSLGGVWLFAAAEPAADFPNPELPEGQSTVESVELESFLPIMVLAQAASTDAAQEIPRSLRNNRYFTESLRMANLAQLAYNEGDYDKSAEYAEDAVVYARQSDEYIALQLKIRETNNAIASAKRQLDQTALSGIPDFFPNEYSDAREFYNSSIAYRNVEDYDRALEAANRVGPILAALQLPSSPAAAVAPGPVETAPLSLPEPALPAQYTVRSWNVWRDCLWNIAGQSWAYADPARWRVIYEANRAKFPQPDNPNLIIPGMVLDIPGIQGELRRGMWDERTEYPSLR